MRKSQADGEVGTRSYSRETKGRFFFFPGALEAYQHRGLPNFESWEACSGQDVGGSGGEAGSGVALSERLLWSLVKGLGMERNNKIIS